MSYTDTWQDESDSALAARLRGDDLGVESPSETTAALLSLLAAAVRASAVVEVGTGVGVTGLGLLEGIAAGGVLTTIDSDANHHSAAKEAFSDASVDPSRARLINGDPTEVLPRLADGVYDLVVVNDPGNDPGFYLEQTLRLLRSGGIVVINGALGKQAAVTDLAQRDAQTVALRAVGQAIKEDERLTSVMLPLDDGVLAAVKG